MKKRYVFGMAIFCALTNADRYTKLLVLREKSALNGRVLLPGLLEYWYAENRGAAFSMLPDLQPLFLCLALACAIGALIYMSTHPALSPIMVCAICAFMAGALGNAWDRLQHGFVIDFIHPTFINFAIFNLADAYITCSAVVLACAFLWSERFTHD